MNAKQNEKEFEIISENDSKKIASIEYSNELSLTRSNSFISIRYHASTMESKLLALGLTRLQHNFNKDYEVSFTTKELCEKLGIKNQTYKYEQLRVLAERIVQNIYIIDDPETDTFEVGAIIPKAKYDKGVFTLTFSETVKNHILQLDNNFTTMSIPVLLGFKNERNNSTYRIYEILRKELYHINKNVEHFLVKYNLSNFMLMIGLVDISDKNISPYARKKNLTPDELVETISNLPKLKKSSWKYEWSEVKKVITKAQKEINEKTDLYFEFDYTRSGLGGKVSEIIFKISKNKDYKPPVSDKFYEDVTPCVEEIRRLEEIIDEKLPVKDKIAIIKAAHFNFERIEKVYRLMKSQKAPIKNVTGWILKGLERNYDLNNNPVKSISGFTEDEVKSLSEINSDADGSGSIYDIFTKNNTDDQDTLISLWNQITANDQK